ncbi:hypothetical protein ATO11_02650 [Pseudaestuariivita atlantica]|uniref:Imelysin-like domain-containing protein n=1 Tax=Pseudaestuariivita atlantica TaxID=1317121 RepID=A0A0L1JUS8_9RHOB|nr:hypothetical protein ATO11_02650 [Pseudaestuariivita atlantica]
MRAIARIGAAIATCLALPGAALAKDPDTRDFCGELRAIAGVGRVIPEALSLDYQRSLPCITSALPEFADRLNSREFAGKSPWLREYLSLTDTAAEILQTYGAPAVRVFREHDSLAVIDALAAGARHTERGVRINSAVILSNVIDNTSTCVVLDHLAAPVRESEVDNPDIVGRSNLIGTTLSVALWAHRDNALALKQTLDRIRERISGLPDAVQNNLVKTKGRIEAVEARLDAARNGEGLISPDHGKAFIDVPLPEEMRAACAAHTYRYWLTDNPYIPVTQ